MEASGENYIQNWIRENSLSTNQELHYRTSASSSLVPHFLLSAFPQFIPFDLLAVKEEPPQERPTANQTLAEVITEQANLSISAARSSKVLYVITTSPSHPPQTVPGSSSQTPSKGVEATELEGSVLGSYKIRVLLGISHSEAGWGSWLCHHVYPGL